MISWCNVCKTLQSGKFCADCGGKIEKKGHTDADSSSRGSEISMDSEDIVVVSPNHFETDNGESSMVHIPDIKDPCKVFENKEFPFYAHAVHSAPRTEGSKYEQRDDIIQMKNIPERMAEKLKFNDKEKLGEIYEQIKARENLDRDMELEINNIMNIETSEELNDQNMKEAARIAREKLTEARETAKDGKTTLKRAMEVIEVALPPFIAQIDKSYEKNELSNDVSKECQEYERCIVEKRRAAFNFALGQEKMEEANKHLEKCIKFAEVDEKKMCEKRHVEESQERTAVINNAKTECNDIISGEVEEVEGWLLSCKSDLQYIKLLQDEQVQRCKTAKYSYEKHEKLLSKQIDVNRQNQEELRRKLQQYEAEERKLVDDHDFQNVVQDTAEKLDEKVTIQLNELHNNISTIQCAASHALKVMESIQVCGNRLLTASLQNEKEYLDDMKGLHVEAKTRWRSALATSAIENRLSIDNVTINIDDYKEKFKEMKEQLKKAVSSQKRLECTRLKKEMKEIKDEINEEEKKKQSAEESLNQMMQTITITDEELSNLGRIVDSVDKLYEWRKQEICESLENDDGCLSLTFTDDEGEDDEV